MEVNNKHAAEHIEPAIMYLSEELNKNHPGRHEVIIAGPVAKALSDFCKQDGEFAQAVNQKRDFEGCLKAICKNIGQAISDFDVYQRAVSFYFPGAKISFNMSIDLTGEEPAKSEPEKKKRIELSFLDIL